MDNGKYCNLSKCTTFPSCAMCAGSTDPVLAGCALKSVESEREAYDKANTRKVRGPGAW